MKFTAAAKRWSKGPAIGSSAEFGFNRFVSSHIIIWMAPAGARDSVTLLRELCEALPHRGMGTPNERKAAEWIAGRLRSLGHKVAVERFRTSVDSLYLMPVQVFACAGAGATLALSTRFVWIGFVLVVCGIAVLTVEVSGFDISVNVLRKCESQNVITEARHPTERTVFVTAHYDTQRGSFLFHPRVVDHLRYFFWVCYSGVLATLVGTVMRIADAHVAAPVLGGGLVLCVIGLGTFVLAEVTGRYTPGANDNGSGVALALWLAEDYMAERGGYPGGCDLRFVFTGCEEAGERGMKAFLRAHANELDRASARFINLDNLGTGGLTFLSGEGMLLYRHAGPSLLRIARDMAAEGGRTVREQSNLLLPTDALPASALGYQAISFLGKDQKGSLGHYHWHTDSFDNIDCEFLRYQQGFFREYVKRVMAARERI